MRWEVQNESCGWVELVSHYLHLDKQKWSALEATLSWQKLRAPQQGLGLTKTLDVLEEPISKNCEKFTLKEPACGETFPWEIPWSQTGVAAASRSGNDGQQPCYKSTHLESRRWDPCPPSQKEFKITCLISVRHILNMSREKCSRLLVVDGDYESKSVKEERWEVPLPRPVGGRRKLLVPALSLVYMLYTMKGQCKRDEIF